LRHLILFYFILPSSPSHFVVSNSRCSLPVLIFFGMYQATPVAQHFGPQTLTSIAIVGALSFANDPRAVFLRNLFISLITFCLAMSITCLGLWCARQAKLHTIAPGDTNLYNSNAAAISATFYFCNLFAINAFRAVLASRPS